MLLPIVFFFSLLATLGALVWSGVELVRGGEDPLGARLEELQAHAMVHHCAPRRPPPRRRAQQRALRHQPGPRRRGLAARHRTGTRARRHAPALGAGAYALFQLLFLLHPGRRHGVVPERQ